MGIFYVRVKIENPVERPRFATISKLLVDTGSEHTWIPRATLERIGIAQEKEEPFVMANGMQITRSIGFAIVRYEEYFTIDEVVFAKRAISCLGARTLEGLNLTWIRGARSWWRQGRCRRLAPDNWRRRVKKPCKPPSPARPTFWAITSTPTRSSRPNT